MTILRDHIAAWLRRCADRVQPPAEVTPDDGIEIPPPPAAPPSFVTPEQIRAAHNRRLIQRAKQGREGVVSIEHLGRVR